MHTPGSFLYDERQAEFRALEAAARSHILDLRTKGGTAEDIMLFMSTEATIVESWSLSFGARMSVEVACVSKDFEMWLIARAEALMAKCGVKIPSGLPREKYMDRIWCWSKLLE